MFETAERADSNDISDTPSEASAQTAAGLYERRPTVALADRLTERTSSDLCSLGKVLEQLDGAELAALKSMLGTPDKWGWDAPEIYEALKDEGYAVGFKAINKHRGGKCRCAQAAA